ncbi:Rhotekin-2 [Portunus trituberculatus]|uniref:Rhotekin-2 n=1 Tax=Portunus trituberculatus TaxID=210409 RepID=A0A5B7IKM5_PORTR|nr:Rhotekin-2 [Portunus trituberculatus]
MIFLLLLLITSFSSPLHRFAVFVLLKIGTEIYDTVMVNPIDRSMTDICFDDIIVFNNIPASFECKMEVYSHVLQNDLTMASTPRKLKRSLHSSISRTVGRKLAATLRDELANGEMYVGGNYCGFC